MTTNQEPSSLDDVLASTTEAGSPHILDEAIKNIEERKKRIQGILAAKRSTSISYASLPRKEVKIVDKINERRKELENDAFAQDIVLKKATLLALFIFLALETLVIFAFALFQALYAWGFMLEEWSFKLLITATITQITVMLLVAVKHLFPQQK